MDQPCVDVGVLKGLEATDDIGPAPLPWRRRTALEMLLSGLIGLYASFVLSVEALALAADRDAALGCDLTSVISCSTVGLSDQASLVGFPNAFLGIAAESVVITVAVATLGGSSSRAGSC